MISLTFDLAADTAKLAQNTTIKLGADVPVTVTFTTAPGSVAAIEFALGTDTTSPATLAYTDAFTQVNSTTWMAILDASDTRLVTYLSGLGNTNVSGELVCVIDGRRRVAPNVQITIQPRIISGPTTTDGGPSYYTEDQSDARFVQSGNDTSQHKYGAIPLSAGDDSRLITFATAFATTPTIGQAWITIPADGSIIECTLDNSTITNSGATIQFGATVPTTGYALHWEFWQ